MAKDLAVRDQARALPQQLTGQRVSKPMRANVRKASPQACPFDDVADEVGPNRSARCSTRQEQMSSALRVAAAGQIVDHAAPTSSGSASRS